jgi:hypothetical protein
VLGVCVCEVYYQDLSTMLCVCDQWAEVCRMGSCPPSVGCADPDDWFCLTDLCMMAYDVSWWLAGGQGGKVPNSLLTEDVDA